MISKIIKLSLFIIKRLYHCEAYGQHVSQVKLTNQTNYYGLNTRTKTKNHKKELHILFGIFGSLLLFLCEKAPQRLTYIDIDSDA